MSKNAPRAKKVQSAKTPGAKRTTVKAAQTKPTKKGRDDEAGQDAELEELPDEIVEDAAEDAAEDVTEDVGELEEDDAELIAVDDEEVDLALELYSSEELEDDTEPEQGDPEDGEIVEELRENPLQEASEEEDEVVEVLGGLEDVIGFDDTVQNRQKRRTVDEDDEDDDESYLVREKQSYEFLCQGCYLVRNKAQQRVVDPALCNDCF
jgi:hypothetical protein